MAMNSQILSKEQVLIVGCGDIGQRFAKALSSEDYQITGLRRSACKDLPYLRYISCDATNPAQLDEVIRQADYKTIVITMTPTERSDSGYQRAYVQTCKNLVASLQGHDRQPRLVLFVSSTAVYGQDNDEWVDEESPANSSEFNGQRLLEAEQVLWGSGFAAVSVRFSGIYGPGRYRLIEAILQGKASTSTHTTNRIHADDGAAALAHLVALARKGVALGRVYIATDSEPAPLLEVNRWLAQQLDVGDFTNNSVVAGPGGKRCSNNRLLSTGFILDYPDYRVGYAELLKTYQSPR